jgi:hypothetical protein
MKFAVVTYGTEGDARPFAALCRALMSAGHQAHLLADASTLGSARALGVPAVALAGDIRGRLEEDHAISGVIAQGGRLSSTVHALAGIANANAEAWLRRIVEVASDCDAIIVAGLAAFAGLSAAEYLGLKAIGAGMIPITPTAAFASPFLPPGIVPRWLNQASHRLVNGMLWRAFRKSTNAARAKVCGLPARAGMERASDALRGFAEPAGRARRLAGPGPCLRSMDGAGEKLDAAVRARRFSGRGRSTDLYRLRQHERIRPLPAAAGDDQGRRRPADAVLSGLERRGSCRAAVQFLRPRRHAA